jgi:transposase, IS5 family
VPFDPSLLVHFRTRIKVDIVNKINQEIVRKIGSASTEFSEKKR